MKKFLVIPAIALLLLPMLTGCTNFGPRTVVYDRYNYNIEVSNSWKEQTLLNIVKLRYADMPLFVEVASIVSGYTLESSVNLSANFIKSGDSQTIGGTGSYSERPTITYSPITGEQFNLNFMTPIPPKVILYMMQSGWPLDLILPLCLEAINGFQSRVIGGVNAREGDPEFYRAIRLLRKFQKSGSVGMRIKKKPGSPESTQNMAPGKESTVLLFYNNDMSEELKSDIDEFRSILKLNLDSGELTVKYGFIPGQDREIIMMTRSMLQIMIHLSLQINVPQVHIERGLTLSADLETNDPLDKNLVLTKLIDIKSSETRPNNEFTTIKYKDHWFWIDDSDFRSKRTFTFLMLLFSMTESGGKGDLPIVTIPAG